MKKKFLPGFVLALAMSGVFGDVSFAVDMALPAASQAGAAPAASVMTDVPPVLKTGGWSKFELLSSADKAVFIEALAGLTGVNYEPLVVSRQVVAGMNYDFFCNAKVVYPGAEWYPAMVRIYKPLKGKASIAKIIKIEIP